MNDHTRQSPSEPEPGAAPTSRSSADAGQQARVVPSDTSSDEAEHDPNRPSGDRRPVEIGGQKGPEPTRYGDWEKNGRCTDF